MSNSNRPGIRLSILDKLKRYRVLRRTAVFFDRALLARRVA
ncbi:MAG: hypothetical protein OEV88_17780 [Gammaproteobacteria bacterium]|nr:hypothetical protein [Gammaproteobacteria bacterium]